MGRVVGVVTAAVVLGSSAACSPGINAAVGIGYDAQGRLVGAVHVCHGNVVRVRLAPTQPEGAADLGSWHRKPPLTGTETWLLQDGESGQWRTGHDALPTLAPGTEYTFWAEDKNVSNLSGMTFHAQDLAHLKPGELLVEHDSGPTDAQGYPTSRLVTIPLVQMRHESC